MSSNEIQFTVYGRKSCPYTESALNILRTAKQRNDRATTSYNVLFRNSDLMSKKRRDFLSDNGHFTVPAIFVKVKNVPKRKNSKVSPPREMFLGGRDDLLKYMNE